MHSRAKNLLSAVAFLIMAGAAFASSGDDYELSWWSVDGGGAVALGGGDFALAGVAGQPEGGRSSGADTSISGGFWHSPLLEPVTVTAREAIDHLLGLATLTGTRLTAADANGDGRLDAADLVYLLSQ